MNYKVTHLDEELLNVYLTVDQSCVLFSAFNEGDSMVSVGITVGDSEEHIRSINDYAMANKEITGKGSLKPLLLAINYLNGPFLDYCLSHGFDIIKIDPTDQRRHSAYRRLERYGYEEACGKYYKCIDFTEADLNFKSLCESNYLY